MRLVAIGDEIGTTIEEQIESLKLANIQYIEIRKINDKYLWEFTQQELLELKKILEKENIKVMTLDSPVGKKTMTYERKKELFEIYIKMSKIFKNKYIRIFSNIGKELTEESIKASIKQYCKKAKKAKIELIMENERKTFAKSPKDCLELIENENNINILFDPENAFFEGYEILEEYEKSKKRITYIHLRDFDTKLSQYAYLGNGDLRVKELLDKLKNDEFNNIISIETHLPMNNSGKTKQELFLKSMENFNEIIKELKIEVE